MAAKPTINLVELDFGACFGREDVAVTLGVAGEVLVAEAAAGCGGPSVIAAEALRLFLGATVLRGILLTAAMVGGTTSLETLAGGTGLGATGLGGLWLGNSGLGEGELDAIGLVGGSGAFGALGRGT